MLYRINFLCLGAISPFWPNGLQNDSISLPKAVSRSSFAFKVIFALKASKFYAFTRTYMAK
jgi:hypothetical protein